MSATGDARLATSPPTRRVSRAPVVVVLGGLALALAAVLVGAELSAAPPPPAALTVAQAGTPAAPREVNVIMRDYVFLPDPIALVPGETVRLNVINGGLEPHELVLGGVDVQRAWATAEGAQTPPSVLATLPPASVPPGVAGLRVLLASGERTSVVYRVPIGGELTIACHIPGHLEQGMVGGVEFVAPATGR